MVSVDTTIFYSHLAEILDTDESKITPTGDLESLGWSSLAVVSFIAFADESLDIIVEPRKLAMCKTVQDLVGLLDGKVSVPDSESDRMRP